MRKYKSMKLNISREVKGKRITVASRMPQLTRDDRALRKYLQKRLEILWKGCVKAFIHELVSNISVDTGMSASSVLPLAAKVRIATEVESRLILGRVKSGPKRGYGDPWQPSIIRSRTAGRRLGQQALSSKRHYVSFGTNDNLHAQFRFEIVVFQYEHHEVKWNSIERAKEAFRKHWKRNLKKVIKNKALLNWIIQGNIYDAG